MTAEELIKKLSKYPKAKVRIWGDDIGDLEIIVPEHSGKNNENVVINIRRKEKTAEPETQNGQR